MEKRHDDAAIDELIGQRLKQIRLMRQWSQQQLGDAIGVSYQQVQKYEGGVDRISGSKLFRTAQALNVSIADLFPSKQLPRLPNVNKRQRRLLHAYAGLPDRQQRAFLALIEAATH